ncbi:MAG TPA: translation initiation factor IF-2 [Syntrophomonadaceae bacterium]|nr:translation initiation factor IF-2 [Syntrophomonadaceae bacterium]
MAKIRVHELAKELGVQSRDLVTTLKDLGLDVKNHMSTLEESQVIWFKKQLKSSDQNDKETISTPKQKTKDKKLANNKTTKSQPRETTKGSQPRPASGGQSRPANASKAKPASGGQSRPANASKPKPASGGQSRPANASKAKPASNSVKKPGVTGAKGTPQSKTSTRPKKDYSRKTRKPKQRRKKEEVVEKTPDLIAIEDTITVRDFAEMINKNPVEIVKKLMDLGTLATVNQDIDYDTAEIIASLYEVKVEKAVSEEELILEEIIDEEKSMKIRAPIVTVMGHVDHGKTSLLDQVRAADVVSGEAGGITQHIGAYQVEVNGNKITFIDTPGHEAFTAMRARGANLTDIVILVIAADDGVMPQTIEAINHIKAAGVPFLVAVNKIDKPSANPDKVMQQLTEYNIVPEEWGGDTIFVPVSAKTGDNIDTMLEMILLLAEISDITANPDRFAEGVVIEGELDKGRGPVATVLVLKGTLKIGDFLICGNSLCKVRAMSDYRGRRVDEALPSMPVEIMGWSDVPEAGAKVQACDEKIAKEVLSLREGERKLEIQKRSSKVSLDEFFKQMQDSEIKELNLIIKGDVQGSVEALGQSLLRLSTDEVKVSVIHSAVGAVTETDVMLATASNAIIIGFNVRPDSNARKSAEQESIDVRLYRVIYEAIEDVKKAMTGLLDPEYKEKYIGRAEVKTTFKVPNMGTIAGSYVIDGKMQRNANIRVLRDGVITYEGTLSSLKRFKDDVREVSENYECGIGIKDFNDIKDGDVIEAFVMEEIPREL